MGVILLMLDFHSETPIYQQIAEQLESAILSGAYGEEAQIPSTTEISVQYKINPATVLKGVSLLVDDGILYKRRGMGMFVAAGAKEKVMGRRKRAFFDHYVLPMLTEAKKLSVTKDEIGKMIERGYEK
jgi:DNA-binding transcriptional regulator YhcF (GntR family)